jgi:hypothetical protein
MSPVDDIHLLLARQPHEVDRVARDADRQARVLLRVVHRVEQRLAVQHVDVHVIAGHPEVGVEDRGQVGDPVLLDPTEAARDQRDRERDAVGRIAVGNLGHRRG